MLQNEFQNYFNAGIRYEKMGHSQFQSDIDYYGYRLLKWQLLFAQGGRKPRPGPDPLLEVIQRRILILVEKLNQKHSLLGVGNVKKTLSINFSVFSFLNLCVKLYLAAIIYVSINSLKSFFKNRWRILKINFYLAVYPGE